MCTDTSHCEQGLNLDVIVPNDIPADAKLPVAVVSIFLNVENVNILPGDCIVDIRWYGHFLPTFCHA